MITSRSTEVLFDQLKDILSVEEQVTETMPDLIGWSSEPSLTALLQRHHLESQRHRVEVTAIFESHGVEGGDDVCKAMSGLIEGGNQHIQQARDPITRDLLLIAHSTRMAHYEIAAYGFTAAIAGLAALRTEARILAEILKDEQAFLRDLAQVGEVRFGMQARGAAWIDHPPGCHESIKPSVPGKTADPSAVRSRRTTNSASLLKQQGGGFVGFRG